MAILVNKIKNNSNFLEICGQSESRLYFANQSPDTIFFTGENLKGQGYFTMPLHNPKIKSRFETEINSGVITLFAGNVPAVYLSQINSSKKVQTLYLPAIYSRSVWVDHNNVMFRIVQKNKGKLDQVFAKLNTETQSLIYEKGISELNGDVGFSTDGLLHYDTTAKLAVYIEFYRNRITVFDTGFRMAYRGCTIDTVKRNPTNYNAMKIGNSYQYTNNSPKHLVNMESCTDHGLLFVQSELQADNEQASVFLNNSVIDMYDIKNRKYKGSFYVPVDNSKKFYKFRVFGKLLVVLFKEHVAIYRLDL